MKVLMYVRTYKGYLNGVSKFEPYAYVPVSCTLWW